MSLQEVPLNALPNQTISVPLVVDGGDLTLTLYLRYNEIANYWVMSLEDAFGNLLADSIPFVTGNAPACNILEQFAYLQVGSAYIINQALTPVPDYPNSVNLGSDFVLVWGDTPGYVAA